MTSEYPFRYYVNTKKNPWSFPWKWATWEIFDAGHAGGENELLFFGWSSILGTPTVPPLFGFRRERPSFSHISLLMFFVASQPKLCQSSFWKILSFFHFINLVLIFKYILNFEAWYAQYLLLLSFSLTRLGDIKSITFMKVTTGWKRKFLLMVTIFQPPNLLLKEKVLLKKWSSLRLRAQLSL